LTPVGTERVEVMDIGPWELLIVLAIVLLVFGSTKLPKLARSMGQASKEFKKGLSEGATDEPDDKK
jgi:sec-independent protein translocase protein TatA